MDMKKYAIINYEFSGKVDWENGNTISVNNGKWDISRAHILRIGLIKYLIFRTCNKILEKIK